MIKFSEYVTNAWETRVLCDDVDIFPVTEVSDFIDSYVEDYETVSELDKANAMMNIKRLGKKMGFSIL